MQVYTAGDVIIILLARMKYALCYVNERAKHTSSDGEGLGISLFNSLPLGRRKAGEFHLPRALGEPALVLAQHAEKEIDGAVGHFDNGVDAGLEGVVPAQILGFLGQVLKRGLLHAGIEELRLRRGVEKPVKVAGVVQHLDIAVRCGLPLHEGQDTVRIGFKDFAVGVDALQNGGGDGKNDAWRIEALRRQHMMDQIAVNAAIAVLEGVDGDKAEGE